MMPFLLMSFYLLTAEALQKEKLMVIELSEDKILTAYVIETEERTKQGLEFHINDTPQSNFFPPTGAMSFVWDAYTLTSVGERVFLISTWNSGASAQRLLILDLNRLNQPLVYEKISSEEIYFSLDGETLSITLVSDGEVVTESLSLELLK